MVSPLFPDGPVTVGMSLDIASIDTISEINMVGSSRYFIVLYLSFYIKLVQSYTHANHIHVQFQLLGNQNVTQNMVSRY